MKDEKVSKKEAEKAAKQFIELLKKNKLYDRIKALSDKVGEEE